MFKPSTLFLFTFVLASVLSTNAAHANTYGYNCLTGGGGTVMTSISISPTGPFQSSSVVTFTASGQIASTCSGRQMNLKAQNDSGAFQTLIPNTFINPTPAYPFVPAFTTFSSPGPAGTYQVNYITGVDDSSLTTIVGYLPGSVVKINRGYDYNNPNHWDEYGGPDGWPEVVEAWYEGSICLNQVMPIDTTVKWIFPGGFIGNGISAQDWNGWQYINFVVPAGQICVNANNLMNSNNTCTLDNSNSGGCFATGIGSVVPPNFGITELTPGATNGFLACLSPGTPGVGADPNAECNILAPQSWTNPEICANGTQYGGPDYVVPQGMAFDSGHNCVPIPPSSDICPNIAGTQSSMPAGYIYDMYGLGTCVTAPNVIGSARLFSSMANACGSQVSTGYQAPNDVFITKKIYTDALATVPLNGQDKWLKVVNAQRSTVGGSYAIKVHSDGEILDKQVCD